jgi:antitoxin component YwqK of YwqJK toxin-antitoxin module
LVLILFLILKAKILATFTEIQLVTRIIRGSWRIWDELGTQRYELNYYEGKKVGIWRMWDEKGNLIDEKRY